MWFTGVCGPTTDGRWPHYLTFKGAHGLNNGSFWICIGLMGSACSIPCLPETLTQSTHKLPVASLLLGSQPQPVPFLGSEFNRKKLHSARVACRRPVHPRRDFQWQATSPVPKYSSLWTGLGCLWAQDREPCWVRWTCCALRLWQEATDVAWEQNHILHWLGEICLFYPSDTYRVETQ